MGTGAITQYIDVAQVVFYIFLLFFIGLVIYLTLESKREGFPLETERFGQVRREDGILGMSKAVITTWKLCKKPRPCEAGAGILWRSPLSAATPPAPWSRKYKAPQSRNSVVLHLRLAQR